MNVRIYKVKNYSFMSKRAADFFSAQILLNPESVIGLATGSTPIGLYNSLIELYKEGHLDFSRVTSINLDEYMGLDGGHPQSYRYFMNENLFDHINIEKDNTFVPNGTASDAEAECRRYDGIIESHGSIDMQLLGIGENGHIGFNEPENRFVGSTHVVKLTNSTIEANSRNFDRREDVPTHAISMGTGHILQSKKIILVASGPKKAEALYNAFYGPVTPLLPASVLQLHGDVTLIADEDALSRFPK